MLQTLRQTDFNEKLFWAGISYNLQLEKKRQHIAYKKAYIYSTSHNYLNCETISRFWVLNIGKLHKKNKILLEPV